MVTTLRSEVPVLDLKEGGIKETVRGWLNIISFSFVSANDDPLPVDLRYPLTWEVDNLPRILAKWQIPCCRRSRPLIPIHPRQAYWVLPKSLHRYAGRAKSPRLGWIGRILCRVGRWLLRPLPD